MQAATPYLGTERALRGGGNLAEKDPGRGLERRWRAANESTEADIT